jgi:hypothetical protein
MRAFTETAWSCHVRGLTIRTCSSSRYLHFFHRKGTTQVKQVELPCSSWTSQPLRNVSNCVSPAHAAQEEWLLQSAQGWSLLTYTPGPSPTAQSLNGDSKLHVHILPQHSRGIPAPGPTATTSSDLQMLLHCMSLHSMGNPTHGPTAAHLKTLLAQLKHRFLRPTHTHSPWPTATVAKSALLQLHMCEHPKGSPHASPLQ